MKDAPQEPAIDVLGLRKVYNRKVAVEDLSLTVGRGEVFGLEAEFREELWIGVTLQGIEEDLAGQVGEGVGARLGWSKVLSLGQVFVFFGIFVFFISAGKHEQENKGE